ncbi:MAG: hypothetical protein M9898_02100 [Chitinophagaceae bacterium]|nr:hypothetical protein [Chitinophagaceae bacterium]
MKKIVSDFIKSMGGYAAYSGKQKTLFIKGKNASEIEIKIIEKFGYDLPFRIASQENLK